MVMSNHKMIASPLQCNQTAFGSPTTLCLSQLHILKPPKYLFISTSFSNSHFLIKDPFESKHVSLYIHIHCKWKPNLTLI